MIQKFDAWKALNENVTPEQALKVFDEAEKWGRETGIEVSMDKEHLDSPYANNYVYAKNIFGLWRLDLEKSTKKAGQNSNYQETYERGTGKKWYITYPGNFNSYNHRSRTFAGNFKTFKSLVEEFLEVKKVYDKVSVLFESMGLGKIVTDHHQSEQGTFVIYIGGKNLKSLYTAINGNTTQMMVLYSREEGWKGINPEKTEIFHEALRYVKAYYRKVSEIENLDECMSILESLKEVPTDEFLRDLETSGWKGIKDKYKGRIAAKKYDL
jgi:hypothetical protein